MERLELSQNLSKTFEAWKTGKTEAADLNEAIRLAVSNGIDLVLKIPNSVFNEKMGKRPISRRDAIELSTGMERNLTSFYIPSELNKNRVQYNKRFELIVVNDYRDGGPSLLIRSKSEGTFGIFSRDQIAALEPK
jgi:hypothetical protein